MTVTDIRTRITTCPEPTVESEVLAEIDAQIAVVTAKLTDPHGWADMLLDEKSRLLGLRAELLETAVELTATTVLAA